MAGSVHRPGALPLVGCELAFDFTNTESGCGSPYHFEQLRSARDVIAWARHAKVVTEQDHGVALTMVDRDRRLGDRLLTEVRAVRATIHDAGAAISRGGKPSPAHLDRLVATHTRMLAAGRLVPFGDGFVWSWDPKNGLVEAILGPITLSALTLLTQQDLSRIKQCAGDHCGWLFFDTTKNKSRRWCDMEVCGNRAKQRHFAQRRKRAPRRKSNG